MAVDIEHVYQAIANFNCADTTASSRSAKWLNEFQRSFDAWLIADRILSESRSCEATLFAAQTIRQKLLYDFRELPDVDSYASLRDSIINHFSLVEAKFGDKSMPIMTQLAAALAILYLQVPVWNDLVEKVLERVSSSTNALLTCFKVFPEEIYNRYLRIGENRRNVVEKELADKTNVIAQFLSQMCQSSANDNAMQTRIISCFSSWLLNKQCSTTMLAQNDLMHSILYALTMPSCDSEVHDAARECVVNALFLVDNVNENVELAKLLQDGIYSTANAFNAAIAEEDQEKLHNYAQIYCEMCESFLPEITAHPSQSQGFGDLHSLELLLRILDYHDYSLAEMTFNVFYRLSEFLYQANDQDFEELRVVFRPIIERYIIALCRHCRLESDMQGIVSPNSDIAGFREKAAESVKDVTFIIGSVDLLKKMMNVLESCSRGAWDETEAVLFVISCVIHNVLQTEDEVVPKLLNAIFSFSPTTHPMLLNTTVLLLGNLNEWLAYNTQYLDLTVRWIVSLVSDSVQLLKTIAEALENICDKGYKHLNGYFEPISDLILRLENAQTEGQTMESASHHLLRACTHLVNDLPAEQMAARLELICARSMEYLSKIITGELSDVSSTADKENAADSWRRLSVDPVLWLDRLAAIFRVLRSWQAQEAFKQQKNGGDAGDAQAPWLQLAIRVWQAVSATLDRFKQSARVAEHACRTIRFLIRSMGIQSIVFIDKLAQQIMTIYDEHPHSCFLYLASIIVDEYAVVEHVQDGLVTMMNLLAHRSFVLLQNDGGSLRNHPDTVDDLFRLAIRFAQRLPHKFYSEPVANELFQGAIVGLELDHVDANRSVSKFVLETIDAVRKNKVPGNPSSLAAEQIILKYGDQLIWHAINATVFHLSNSLKKEMSEVVYAVGQWNKQKLAEWLTLAVGNLPHDSGLSATSQQLNEFKDGVIASQKQYEVLGLLRNLCRYYS